MSQGSVRNTVNHRKLCNAGHRGGCIATLSALLVGVTPSAHYIERNSWIPSAPNPIAPKFDFFDIGFLDWLTIAGSTLFDPGHGGYPLYDENNRWGVCP